MRIIVFFFFFSLVQSQYLEDSYLRAFCNHYNGHFTQRTETKGDLCTDMKFTTFTSSEQEAKEFCELYAPWRQRGAVHGKITKCSVEATVTCASGWIQMFEWCYQLPKESERFSSDKAAGVCKSARSEAQVATIRHRYHVGVLKRFFESISQVWITASESFDKYVDVKQANGALALAFNGMAYGFSTKPNSLVRVDPKSRLQVLCEYKPPSTPAEARYLGERYAEIYWPGISLETGYLVRSGSHYPRGKSHEEICKGVLKPFGFNDYEPLVIDDEVMENWKKQNNRDERSTALFARTAAENLMPPQNTAICERVTDPFLIKKRIGNVTAKFNWSERNAVCDNMLSTALMLRKYGPALTIMSDAQTGPVWCKMGKVRKFVYKDIPGYVRYNRSNGEVVGHKFVLYHPWTQNAKENCDADGAFFSGFDSYDEYLFLLSLFVVPNKTREQARLGARRRPECQNIGPNFSADPKHICSRGRVIAWQNHVAHEPIDDRCWATNDLTNPANDGVLINPDNKVGYNYQCLALHNIPSWHHDPNSEGLLDDRYCNEGMSHFCQKTLELVEVD